MIREGDYIYVHTLYSMDRRRGVEKGIYKVKSLRYKGVVIKVHSHSNFMEYDQYFKILPNKINKLLYKGL